MFNGEFNHTVDTKGRLIVPVKFREELGDEFTITRGLDGCLLAFPQKAWEEFEAKLQTMPLTKKDARTVIRFFVAGAQTVELDKQGRALLPQALREFAGLEKEVVLAGMLDRIEIWDKSKWYSTIAPDNIDEIAESLADRGFEF